MTQLKRHESPRKPGRNSKGKQASARLRQIAKRNRQLSEKLKRDRTQQKED